jgi:hypothetical protein
MYRHISTFKKAYHELVRLKYFKKGVKNEKSICNSPEPGYAVFLGRNGLARRARQTDALFAQHHRRAESQTADWTAPTPCDFRSAQRPSKIELQEAPKGESFAVLDANATDGSATFQLPIRDLTRMLSAIPAMRIPFRLLRFCAAAWQTGRVHHHHHLRGCPRELFGKLLVCKNH